MNKRDLAECSECHNTFNHWDLNDNGVCYKCEDLSEEPTDVDWENDHGISSG